MIAAALTEAIKAQALTLGFDLVAVGPADPPEHADSFRRWIDAGHAGTMGYLERRLPERVDPRRVLADARSVVTVALNYHQGESPDASWKAVARYAWGRDYHDVMTPRLEALARFIGEAAGARGKCYVDTGPLLERDLAARAGLGWVGKNTMLLNPGLGSWFFIGVLLTTAELVYGEPLPDRCGTCRACLDACPTDAFVAPRVLDATRCVSYLTIELKGAIPEALRAGVGDRMYGCDVCQSCCPWNIRFSRELGAPAFAAREAIAGKDARQLACDLLGMTPEEFSRAFKGSPMKRAKLRGLKRNAAVVLGNVGTLEDVPVLEQALDDPEPLVREHAAWALARLAPR